MPFLLHGGQAAYHLTPPEIAIICASHSGTDEHYQTVQGIQAKAGIHESELLCGTHPLTHLATVEAMRDRGEPVTSNRHNCSGKHTGMLAYTRLKKLPADFDLPYINPAHPIQKDILENFAGMAGLSPEQVVVGVDGCSAPNFAVPLYNGALAYARLCDPSQLDAQKAEVCRTITQAMSANPFMVGGPDSFDTHLMEAGGGRIICKGGAEGYQALGILPGALGKGSPGLGVAIKISDGDLGSHTRAPFGHVRPAVSLEALRQLGVLSPAELEKLASYGPVFSLHNWMNLEVGKARPTFTLSQGNYSGSLDRLRKN